MPDTVNVRLRCFAQVKDALGREELGLTFPAGATTVELEKRVRELAAGKLDRITLRVAVNRRYAPEPVPLHDGDEVALIPPVQGG
jgi:molybdopterin converting factor small subunit